MGNRCGSLIRHITWGWWQTLLSEQNLQGASSLARPRLDTSCLPRFGVETLLLAEERAGSERAQPATSKLLVTDTPTREGETDDECLRLRTPPRQTHHGEAAFTHPGG